jgi:hypothetical protein
MPRNAEARESVQLGLFQKREPDIELSPTGRQQLEQLIEVLLLEIAAALPTQEVGDDQDHG